ncbi:hypothetical protein QIS74_00438 [Colletotrichum tabaci]|uniref:Uncharacterized protein n=1 Tax=Colletotrichum tabaci TaxID=1209068 RepID=A0AAV9TTG2_9PEZI
MMYRNRLTLAIEYIILFFFSFACLAPASPLPPSTADSPTTKSPTTKNPLLWPRQLGCTAANAVNCIAPGGGSTSASNPWTTFTLAVPPPEDPTPFVRRASGMFEAAAVLNSAGGMLVMVSVDDEHPDFQGDDRFLGDVAFDVAVSHRSSRVRLSETVLSAGTPVAMSSVSRKRFARWRRGSETNADGGVNLTISWRRRES